MVADAAEAGSDIAKNLENGGEKHMVPYCFAMDGGPPCTSRTPVSSKAKQNVNCVQDEVGATGEGFKNVRQEVEKHGPTVLALECVGAAHGEDA